VIAEFEGARLSALKPDEVTVALRERDDPTDEQIRNSPSKMIR